MLKPVIEPFSSVKAEGAKSEVVATMSALVLGSVLLLVAVFISVVLAGAVVSAGLAVLVVSASLSPPQANSPRLIANSRLGLNTEVCKKLINTPKIQKSNTLPSLA